MEPRALEQVASSRARLRIASLLSTRPRTLSELSYLTGISVQAVLKHLEKLTRLGLLEERRISARSLPARKVYRLKDVYLADFSQDDMIVVKASKKEELPPGTEKDVYSELESYAEDALILRRRIRDQARKLSRLIDELALDESRLASLVEALELTEAEKLTVQAIFTEESLEDAARVLSTHYGRREPRKMIEALTQKLRGYERN